MHVTGTGIDGSPHLLLIIFYHLKTFIMHTVVKIITLSYSSYIIGSVYDQLFSLGMKGRMAAITMILLPESTRQ